MPLQHDPAGLPDQACTVHARTRLAVLQDCTAAFEYYASDDVEVELDGRRLTADDETGAGRNLFYELHPSPAADPAGPADGR